METPLNPLPRKAGRPKGTPGGGRPKGPADATLTALLEHLRQWLDTPVPHEGTNWKRINKAEIERTANVRAGYLAKWHTRSLSNKVEVKLKRDEFERLAPLLQAWYGYKPPTI